eukprot:2529456-Prymnesium_polylepis.1
MLADKVGDASSELGFASSRTDPAQSPHTRRRCVEQSSVEVAAEGRERWRHFRLKPPRGHAVIRL